VTEHGDEAEKFSQLGIASVKKLLKISLKLGMLLVVSFTQVGSVWVLSMKIMDTVVMALLGPPVGIYFAREEQSVVGILAKVIFEVVFPRLELLKGESMGWQLIWSSQLEVRHVGVESLAGAEDQN
jgi:hypothetical protein